MLTSHYLTILTIHSYWRWMVLSCLLAAVVAGIRGATAPWPFAPIGRTVARLAIVAVDVQLLLGLCLYSASPLVRAAWADLAGAMKQHELRFFSVEHLTTMLLAVVVAHVGSRRCRRARIDRSAYVNMAGWFGASLALILVGIPWWRPFFRALGLG